MADELITSDPAKVQETLEQVNAIRRQLAELAEIANARSTRNKYEEALRSLESNDLPLIELGMKFTNKSEQSMQQQFKKRATEMKLTWTPSVVFHNGAKFLVNFDAENVEQKLEQYVLRHTGIDKAELANLTRGL